MTPVEPPQTSIRPKAFSPPAFWGSMLGINGWAIGLLVYSVATGSIGDAWSVVLGGMILSTGLGLLLLSPSVRPGTMDWFGRLLITLALLSMVYQHWAAPKLRVLPAFERLVEAQRVTDLFVLSCALVGIVLAVLAGRRVEHPRR